VRHTRTSSMDSNASASSVHSAHSTGATAGVLQGRRSAAGSTTTAAAAAAAGGSSSAFMNSNSNSIAASSSTDSRSSLKRPRPDDSSDGFICSRYWPAGASLADVIRSQCAAELAQLLSAAALDTAALDICTNTSTTAATSASTPADSPTAVAVAAAAKRRRALDSCATATTATAATAAVYTRPASFLFGGADSPLPTPFKQLGARNGGKMGVAGRGTVTGTVLPGLVITPGRHVISGHFIASSSGNGQNWLDDLRQQLFNCLAELDRSSSSSSISSSAASPLDLADVLVCYLEQLGGAAEVTAMHNVYQFYAVVHFALHVLKVPVHAYLFAYRFAD
jgi:hypothetical protein